MKVGEFKHIYDPSSGEHQKWYINDHCFIQDQQGLWHMYGITHAEPAAPLEERFLAHATSEHLWHAPWQKQDPLMHAEPAAGETHVWAPHIIWHDQRYWMYYCGGGISHEKYRIHLAVSKDLWRWERHPGNPMVVDGFDARDPMILRVGTQWVMYYTGNAQPSGGHHVVFAVTSDDLVHWGERREVFRHPRCGTFGGPTESPFVVEHNGCYYLLVCTNDPYNDTAVYTSHDPFSWDANRRVGSVPAHAAEVIATQDGETYLSRAGWGQGGLYLAKVSWM
jgi:beta-xylosidase